MGVKYCFRYNARSRQMRLTEDGEPITMENMPRPHRRRREKKLMTMDEVNEKFPMVKYKNWVATRVKEGLPARGGVSAPPSRANSVRSVEGVVPASPSKAEADATADVRPTTPKEKADPTPPPKEGSSSSPDTAPGEASTSVAPAAAATPTPPRASDEHTDDEDDEHINAAIPPECMGTTGDTCAICIDTIEDDDDVRGLTCGHAFHAVCLDPWLTSRRACCPLCKADYYTPKPRPPAAEGADASGSGYVTIAIAGDGRQRMNMPSRPTGTWISMRGTGRMFPVRFVIRGGDHVIDQPGNADAAAAASSGRRWPSLFNRSRQRPDTSSRPTTAPRPAEAPAGANGPRGNWLRSARGGFTNPLRRQNAPAQAPAPAAADQPVVSGANPVSPSQLEAGVRNEAR